MVNSVNSFVVHFCCNISTLICIRNCSFKDFFHFLRSGQINTLCLSLATSGQITVKPCSHVNVCVCVFVCVKRPEWVLWKQVMMFTPNVCIFKNNGKDKRKTQSSAVNRPLGPFWNRKHLVLFNCWQSSLFEILDDFTVLVPGVPPKTSKYSGNHEVSFVAFSTFADLSTVLTFTISF